MEPTPSFYPDAPIPAVAGSYGSFLRRFAALVIDGILLSVVSGILGSIFGVSMMGGMASMGNTPSMGSIMGAMAGYWVMSIIINWLYSAYFESSERQATLGKLAMGLIVTDEQGQRLSFTTASVRFVGKFISSMVMGLGYLIQPFTAKKQALHDLIAKTLVWKKAA